MYAVIKTGGKQHRVSPGEIIEVERLDSEGEITFTPVLVVDDAGAVTLSPSELEAIPVKARVLEHVKAGKISVFKYRPKTGYKVKRGHRQPLSRIEILAVGALEKATS